MSDHKLIKVLVLLTCLLVIPLHLTTAQAEARVGVFNEYAAPPQTRLEVPIEVRGAQNVYAVDVELTFDPAILAVEDSDPATEGIQPALGTFLDAGLVLYRTVDPQAGVLRFVMTQVNPAEPKSGDGVLLVVYFVTQAEGLSPLTINSVTLSDREGAAIPASAVSSQVEVAEGKPTPQATNIPVQNPTALIIIPTMAPTATPEPTVLPSPTPQGPAAGAAPTQPPSGEQAQNPALTPGGATGFTEVNPSQSGQSRMVWVAVLVVVVVIGLLLRRRWSHRPTAAGAPSGTQPVQSVSEEPAPGKDEQVDEATLAPSPDDGADRQ